MAMAVEAKSLSSVLQTAADPPADPTIPLPNVSEPLALYIVKVPGSKDVFLTPVKPRDKIITAEDIRSSIYFLHVHTPEDDEIIKTASPTSKTEKPKVDAVPPPPPVHKTTPTTSQQQRVIPTVLATSKATATSDVKTLSRINHPLPVLPVDKDNQWPSLLRPGPGMTRAQRPPALAINRRPVNQSILSPSPQSALQNQHNIQQGRRKPGAPGRGIPFSPPYPEIDVFPSAASFLSPKRETHTIHEGQEVTIPQVFELPANEMKSLELPAIETTTQLSNINQQPSYSAPFSSGGLLSPPIQDSQRVSSTFESMVSSAPTSGKPATSFIETPPPTSTRTPASEIKEYQFTLIRRDPVTGKQSNVATIYNHASQTRLNEDQFTFETTPNWMNIVLENPGYEKFNKSHALTSPTHSCADLLSPMMSAVGACSHDSGHRKFHRHLQIEFSKLSSRPAKYSKVLSQDRLDFPENSGVYGRESGDFAASQMSLMSGNHQLHGRRHKSTGFAFRSPWDGRCEFTSATGHSTLRVIKELTFEIHALTINSVNMPWLHRYSP